MNILSKKLSLSNILKSEKNFKNKKYFIEINVEENFYKDKYIELQKDFEKHKLLISSEEVIKNIIDNNYGSVLNNEFLNSLNYKLNFINENFDENTKDSNYLKIKLNDISENLNKINEYKKEIVNLLYQWTSNKGKLLNIDELKENNIICLTGNFLDEVWNIHYNVINYNSELIEEQDNLKNENNNHLNNIKYLQENMKNLQIGNNNQNIEDIKEKETKYINQIKIEKLNFSQLNDEFNSLKEKYDNLIKENCKEINDHLELNKKFEDLNKQLINLKSDNKKKDDEKLEIKKNLQELESKMVEKEKKYEEFDKIIKDYEFNINKQKIEIENCNNSIKNFENNAQSHIQELEIKNDLYDELNKEKIKLEKKVKELNYKRDNGIKEIKRLTEMLENQPVQNKSMVSLNDTFIKDHDFNLNPVKKEVYNKIKSIYKDIVVLIPIKDKLLNTKIISIERKINEIICWLLENLHL